MESPNLLSTTTAVLGSQEGYPEDSSFIRKSCGPQPRCCFLRSHDGPHVSHDFSLDNTCVPFLLGSSPTSKVGGDCPSFHTRHCMEKEKDKEQNPPQRECSGNTGCKSVSSSLSSQGHPLLCTVAWSGTYLYHPCASWEIVTACAFPKGQSGSLMGGWGGKKGFWN